MRSHVHVLAVALLSLAVPATRAAARPPDRAAQAGPYSVELTDEDGNALPTFSHRGRTYVLGSLGDRYLVRVRNHSGRRVEVVASVDGRDVLDGRPATWTKRGYLVDAWSEVAIDGFRTSRASVAAFRFSSVPRSYAALTGDARDVGVVGVAIFPERELRPVAPLRRAEPLADEGRAGAPADPRRSAAPSGEAHADAAPAPQAPAGARAAAPGKSADARASERPGLGTEFAEEHESRVRTVRFERASARPEAVLALRYDDREGLAALGIDVDGRLAARREAWLRETAEPFRESGYAEPPPGWRGRRGGDEP